MQTAAAAILPKPFEITSIPLREARKHETRFFVQMGWEELNVDSQSIPHKQLRRGQIMPCESYQKMDMKELIRESDRIPESETADSSGRILYAKYWRYALHEAERLLEIESNTEHKTGLVEIAALRGKEDLYQRCKLNQLFYAGLDKLPESNPAMIEHLEMRLGQVKGFAHDPPYGIAKDDWDTIYQVGEELIQAARHNSTLQLQLIEHTHACMKLRPNEPMYKKTYDGRDEELLRRTLQRRVHHVDQVTAEAMEILASRGNDDSLKELVAVMRQQLELTQAQVDNQQSLIAALMAERDVKTTRKERN